MALFEDSIQEGEYTVICVNFVITIIIYICLKSKKIF